MFAVIDTNILVSALWSPGGPPAQILGLVLQGTVRPCYDYRIMEEYRDVLNRPKFKFPSWMVNDLLEQIEAVGVNVMPEPLEIPFDDESDKKFLEVARYCSAPLVTGNRKHFPPEEPLVLLASEFLANYFK